MPTLPTVPVNRHIVMYTRTTVQERTMAATLSRISNHRGPVPPDLVVRRSLVLPTARSPCRLRFHRCPPNSVDVLSCRRAPKPPQGFSAPFHGWWTFPLLPRFFFIGASYSASTFSFVTITVYRSVISVILVSETACRHVGPISRVNLKAASDPSTWHRAPGRRGRAATARWHRPVFDKRLLFDYCYY